MFDDGNRYWGVGLVIWLITIVLIFSTQAFAKLESLRSAAQDLKPRRREGHCRQTLSGLPRCNAGHNTSTDAVPVEPGDRRNGRGTGDGGTDAWKTVRRSSSIWLRPRGPGRSSPWQKSRGPRYGQTGLDSRRRRSAGRSREDETMRIHWEESATTKTAPFRRNPAGAGGPPTYQTEGRRRPTGFVRHW